MEQGTGRELALGSMSSSVRLTLITVTTTLFPLLNTSELLSIYSLFL